MEKLEPLNDGIRKSMVSNRRKDTYPELTVRKALRNAGYPGYRLQWKVPGRPDIAYPGKKVAIFVNGCFWHRCPQCNYNLPKHNSEYWSEKFKRNIDRDSKAHAELESMGWEVIVLWECEIKNDLGICIDRIVSALK